MTQEKALEILKSGANVFLTGEPGSGKTYTVNQFREWLSNEYTRYAITASTGIAATHIGGTTIHSWSGIGIKKDITENSIWAMQNNDFLIDRIQNAEVLIVDEAKIPREYLTPDLRKIGDVCKKERGQPADCQMSYKNIPE